MSGELSIEVLRKAAGPGRIRGVALEIWAAAMVDPSHAGPRLKEGLKGARMLHSRERRLVRDALYAMVRRSSRWSFVLNDHAPMVWWLAWLVEEGLAVDEAEAQHPAPYARLANTQAQLASLPWSERLAVRHGVPEPVVERWRTAWGASGAEALLEASDGRAPLTLRVNRQRGTRAQVAERLLAEGVETVPCEGAPWGLRVSGEAQVTQLASYREGWFEVQDEGSQRLLELVPQGARVVDLCAGAGGKSLALADRGHQVVACDVREQALRELSRRARRAGVDIPTVTLSRGALPRRLREMDVDCVLVDAPCSGSGVLRRHPEHRWQLGEQRIRDRAQLQQEILGKAAELVPASGRLVYATCSLLSDENEAVVASFRAAHPDFVIVGEPLTTAPHIDGCDGFFGVALERIGTLHSTAGRALR